VVLGANAHWAIREPFRQGISLLALTNPQHPHYQSLSGIRRRIGRYARAIRYRTATGSLGGSQLGLLTHPQALLARAQLEGGRHKQLVGPLGLLERLY